MKLPEAIESLADQLERRPENRRYYSTLALSLGDLALQLRSIHGVLKDQVQHLLL
jgi:hypothetical protein